MITVFGLPNKTVKIFSLLPILLFSAIFDMGVYSYVPRAVSTPSGSASPPSATAIFSFNKILNMTTCTPATISWIYAPVTDADVIDLDLTLTITNDLPETLVPAPDFFQPLSGGSLDPTASSYTWSSVNVTEGWYAIVATFASGVAAPEESLPFYVVNGTDTSCFGTLVASSAASSPTGTPTSSVGPTSSSPATHTSSKINRQALIGGIMGGIALLAAVIAVYCCLYFRGASALPPRRRGTRKWCGVGSAAPKRRAYLHTNSQFVRGHSFDSFGRILHDDGYILDIGRTSTEEKLEKEKSESISSFFPTEDLHAASMQSASMDYKYSDIDQVSPLPSLPSSHPNSQYSAASTSLTAESHFSHDVHTTIVYPQSSYPPTPLPAFPSGTSFEIGDTPKSNTPRGSAEHSTTTARRIARKAVPQYDSADPVLASSSSTAVPLAPGAPEAERFQGGQKTGFDAMGKSVHYLIPDMPPPAAH